MRSLFIKKSGIWWSLYAACHELSWRGDSKNVAQDGFDPSTLGCRIFIWAPHASTAPPSCKYWKNLTLTYSSPTHLVLLRGLDVTRFCLVASACTSHPNSTTCTTFRICVFLCWIGINQNLYEDSPIITMQTRKRTCNMSWTTASIASFIRLVQQPNYIDQFHRRSA